MGQILSATVRSLCHLDDVVRRIIVLAHLQVQPLVQVSLDAANWPLIQLVAVVQEEKSVDLEEDLR